MKPWRPIFAVRVGFGPSHYSASSARTNVAALLGEAVAQHGLVFVLEDLHKVSPSVLSVIEEGLSLLRSSGRGNISYCSLLAPPERWAPRHNDRLVGKASGVIGAGRRGRQRHFAALRTRRPRDSPSDLAEAG